MIYFQLPNDEDMMDYWHGMLAVAPEVLIRCSCGTMNEFDHLEMYINSSRKIFACEECGLVFPILKNIAPGERSPRYRLGVHGVSI